MKAGWVKTESCFFRDGAPVIGTSGTRWDASLPVFTLMPAVLATFLSGAFPGWVRMWVLASALFFGAKWITLVRYLRSGNRASPGRLLAYGFLWPGMDVRAFCSDVVVRRPGSREWVLAVTKAFFGVAMLWLVSRSMAPVYPLIAGWVGMAGIVLILHFGLFHLLSLAWRTCGVDARPLMQSPATATSVGRFWGEGWNTAFTDLMHEIVFKPARPKVGARHAVVLVFVISGLLHELVLSVPAGGGYGLPTAYFVLQAIGVLVVRSRAGRRLGLSGGFSGWVFVALVAGVPAVWLFPPVFIRNVILPMLHAIGAT